MFDVCHAHAERLQDILGLCGRESASFVVPCDHNSLNALEEGIEAFLLAFSRQMEQIGILEDVHRNELILPTGNYLMLPDFGYLSQQRVRAITRHLDVLMAAGECLAKHGREKAARNLWCKLHRSLPGHAGLHQRLTQASHGQTRSTQPCGHSYRVEPVGSFTHKSLDRPFIMCMNDDNLYVANDMTPVITVFDVQGDYLGDMSGDLISTRGIFPDASGNIWTCDFNTSELICFGRGGTITERIDFNSLLAGHTDSRRPIYGDFDGRHAFIQSSDDSNHNAVLVRLDLESPSNTLLVRQMDGLDTPGGIHCRNGSIFYANQKPPALYGIDRDLSVPFRIYRQMNRWVINFDFTDNMFFVSTPGALTKVDIYGNNVQTIPYENVLNTFNYYIDGVTVYNSGHGKYLFLADANNNHIHKIAI
ncbi:MAG: hypothetical protein FD177_1430 [Desulfovibrionaceae bacterium]|nr:MAG: hypothetical protein FD177_1430 [Desulfovibrionaceae bacterium]